MTKKVFQIAILIVVINLLSIIIFAKSIGGGEWNVGYCCDGDNDIIYSEYLHKTRSHGASTQVWDDDESDWSTERICAPRGSWARSDQVDLYKHSGKHGHGYWHRCGIEIEDCNGSKGIFDY